MIIHSEVMARSQGAKTATRGVSFETLRLNYAFIHDRKAFIISMAVDDLVGEGEINGYSEGPERALMYAG